MAIQERVTPATEQERGPFPAPFLGTIVAIVLCGILPITAVYLTPTETALDGWAWAVVATMIAGARYAWIIASASRRLFEMTTWLFWYLFFGLAPLVQLREQVDPSTTPNLYHQFDGKAFAIIIASQIAFIVGSTVGGRITWGEIPEPKREVSPQKTRNAAALLVVVAGIYVAQIGVSGLFSSRANRSGALVSIISDEAVRAIVVGFVTLGLLVVVVAQLEVRRAKKKAGEKVGFLLLGVSLLLLAAIVNPFGSPRFVLMTVILGVLAAMGLYASIKVFRVVALSAIAGMLALFPILDSFRSTVGQIQSVSPLDALTEGDFDAYGQLLNTIYYVEVHGITWGNQMLGVLFFWVPRSIWPAKPEDTGILLAEDRGYGFTNLSAPLPAELFINGGWAALAICTLLIGYFIRRWDDRNEIKISISSTPSILGCVVPFYLILLLRGSLLQASANLAVILVVWLLVTRKRTPDAERDFSKRSK